MDLQEFYELYFERFEDIFHDMMTGLRDKMSGDGEDKYNHKLVPKSYMKRLYDSYKYNDYIIPEKDYKMIDKVSDMILNRIAVIELSSQLYGHTKDDIYREKQDELEELFPDYKFDDYSQVCEDNGDWIDQLDKYICDERGNSIVTDYGLKPLQENLQKLFETDDYDEKFVFIDTILNVAHQRSDLSAWIFEGGQKTLDELGGIKRSTNENCNYIIATFEKFCERY